MARPKLTKLEMQIMEIFWNHGACCVREIQEAFPERGRPAYTTVQTTVYRLERKKALRIVKRISKANIFEAAISRDDAQRGLIDELLALFGGASGPVPPFDLTQLNAKGSLFVTRPTLWHYVATRAELEWRAGDVLGWVAKGDLKKLIDTDGVKGVTSNPSIFEKAIDSSDEYDGAIGQALKGGDRPVAQLFEHLAIEDIQHAADVLRAVYDELGALDLATPGARTISDVTGCPGATTCNLGITRSLTLAEVLEEQQARRAYATRATQKATAPISPLE